VQRAAVLIIMAEERLHGWSVSELRDTAKEFEHGCDLLSTSASGVVEHVEVKGWGDPLLRATGTKAGSFTWPQPIQPSQYEAACKLGDGFRIEIVGNLTAFLRQEGWPERLTVPGSEVAERAVVSAYEVQLAGHEQAVAPVGVETVKALLAAPDSEALSKPEFTSALQHAISNQPKFV
jgi:hypothetical protein